MKKYKEAFKFAFPLTIPICAAFLFLGLSYGFYICSKGFSPWYPFFTSALVFAGSMEFVLVGMLLGSYDPVYCYLVTLMVNSRHLFYGLSMLEAFKNTGWKKFYLIFGMCDESFAINVSTSIPEGIDKGWFMTFVTVLNQIYWVVGATLGGILGNNISINTKGLDFALVSLFVAIFVSQWQGSENHHPAILGICIPLLCLVILGPQNFVPLAMLLLLAVFVTRYYKGDLKQ
ncbi:MAG: AzlC family ABC transporter permease [Phascolarctobacterium sp.]|nr:AzlC family ABC transporter permease [Phascolarctobacterium sp.]